CRLRDAHRGARPPAPQWTRAEDSWESSSARPTARWAASPAPACAYPRWWDGGAVLAYPPQRPDEHRSEPESVKSSCFVVCGENVQAGRFASAHIAGRLTAA